MIEMISRATSANPPRIPPSKAPSGICSREEFADPNGRLMGTGDFEGLGGIDEAVYDIEDKDSSAILVVG